MADNRTYVLGVSGGMGSGKSSVCRILEELGAQVVDADEISHTVTEGGRPAVYEIAIVFGDRFVDMYGRLNRPLLAKYVFGNRERLDKLEAIVHGYVVEEMVSRVAEFRRRGCGVMVLDVPIPVEHGFLDQVDGVWIVDADTETRIQRVMKRNDISREDAESRIASQLSREEYLALADRVINNDGSEMTLRQTVCREAQTLWDTNICEQ